MKRKLTIVKIGGAVVEDQLQLAELLNTFAKLEGPKLLVHGGGRRATKIASALGIENRMIGGRRITDSNMLEVVVMVYGGLVNKSIVARLQAIGVNAIGLTGADMNIISAHRRPLKEMKMADETVKKVDFGFVGDVDRVDADSLSGLLEKGVTPVVAPLTHDGNGNMLNTNADTIASETAKALAEMFDVTLVYTFEKSGVLRNPDNEQSVIAKITRADFDRLVADGTVNGGMLPKIENALAAVEAGVKEVKITSANNLYGGTTITN
jgi:acetylglutamate kinase